MASIVTFEVQGEDETGDLWIVASKQRDKAEQVADRFRTEGYRNVQINELGREPAEGEGG